jgi:hypothetical protein
MMAVDRGKIVRNCLLWLIIIVVVLWADSSAEEHRQQQPIEDFEVTIEGEGETLIDAALLDEWLMLHDMHPEGRAMANVDLAKLEEVIAEHSAVSSVNAYMTYDGHLVVTATQRKAVARLRIDGYDMYLAADGYLFPVTDCYLLSLPVITGSYEALFDSGFVGYHGDSANDMLSSIDAEITDIEERRVELLKEREAINATLRGVEKEGVKREIFMSDNEYRGRVDALKERKAAARRKHAEEDRAIELALRALDDERLAASLRADHIRGQVADFDDLVAFVTHIVDSGFWRSEIVQIELTGGGDDPMQIAIVPRSGNFIVDMGFAENLTSKLSTLGEFYDKTLRNVGWETYKHISLRYDNQVVCK